MNKANKVLPKEAKEESVHAEFRVGDKVKYHSKKGVIISLTDKKDAMIEIEGMRLRVKTKQLKHTQILHKKPKADLKLSVEKRAGLKCDLHGMRAEEAEEVLDQFLSDALIAGWDEVIVYHGIGTGKLSYAVKNFLSQHPKVKNFEDAPQHMGGYGAKVVRL
jgi:DNA mismatch repair protein MutS2